MAASEPRPKPPETCGRKHQAGRRDSLPAFVYENAKPVSENLNMSEHKHGEMDISVQEKTFEGFVTWSTRVAVFSIVVLILLAIFNT